MPEKGLLVGKGGNYSVRIGENQILLTASGFCKSEISEEQISLVDMEGNLLEGLKPAADIRMHLEVYRSMPEIRAIVHSHPPIMTGFAMSNYTFEDFCMPEAMLDIGGDRGHGIFRAHHDRGSPGGAQVHPEEPGRARADSQGPRRALPLLGGRDGRLLQARVPRGRRAGDSRDQRAGGAYQMTPREIEGVRAILAKK